MKEPPAPGDDVVPTPAPVDECPPRDRFCDLVLTGGVASGVVYPWAIVELARAYSFRNIGGTSVGAMAAALAAAAEYGRRTGAAAPFETLRRLPAALGEARPDGRTRMLSLFQTVRQGRRLIELWRRIGKGGTREPRRSGALGNGLLELVKVYAWPIVLGAMIGLWMAGDWGAGGHWRAQLLSLVLTPTLGAVLGLALALWHDLKYGLIANELGLCKGGTLEAQDPDDPSPGLCEWLHEGIQRSAGLALTDRPLSFRDLWSAPAYPGAPPQPRTAADPASQRAINLQMITSNVTHGRPYRLPLADETSRLFFVPAELVDYLPKPVLDALVAAAPPYRRQASADPEPSAATRDFRELPGADMPVLVAARLSLSFPLLFSAVPLYAIDYENPTRDRRRLKRCLFTDGGASSNFPIHLFDAALPRWPTFGLWLDRRNAYAPPARRSADGATHRETDAESNEDVWLPEYHRQGWGDNWNRFDPRTAEEPEARQGPRAGAPDAAARGAAKSLGLLGGFLRALATGALDWRDRSSFRLPHVRNRVARLLLRPGEGGLHIGMPRLQILDMAHRYGTKTGKLFVARFAEQDGKESPAWREQRWVRLHLLIGGLRERLAGLSTAAAHAAHGLPLTEEIWRATREGPLREREGRPTVSTAQARSLVEQLHELERLEVLLQTAVKPAYEPRPEPELRLRAPL